MNLKNNYKNEVIHIYTTVFMTIFSMIVLICDGIATKQLIEEVSISLLIIVVFLFLGIPSLFLFLTYKSIYDAKVNRKKAKDIIENGIKVQGKIIDIRTEKVDTAKPTEPSRYRYYYHLIVECSNKIESFKVETPRINFHPDYLTSKDVDVYLYQHDFYVDNFKLDLDRIEKDKKKVIKRILIAILSFVLLCIVNAIIIFLSINNVIPSEMGMRLCIISLIISAVIGAGIPIVKGIRNMIKIIKEVYKN